MRRFAVPIQQYLIPRTTTFPAVESTVSEFSYHVYFFNLMIYSNDHLGVVKIDFSPRVDGSNGAGINMLI